MIDIIKSTDLVHYKDAEIKMIEIVENIISKKNNSCIWLLEHHDVYTCGTSASKSDLLDAKNIPVYESGRGGKFTYHGPGQRILYTMINLKQFHQTPDIRKFINQLEQVVINFLKCLGIESRRDFGNIGVWIDNPTPQKIASIGVRVKKWVSFHGIAINYNTNLNNFNNIIPCGIKDCRMTSLEALGITKTKEQLDDILINSFLEVFHVTKVS